jgi:hypothetical protein
VADDEWASLAAYRLTKTPVAETLQPSAELAGGDVVV